jgi:hypothetical protein
MSFKKVIEKYGYPTIGKEVAECVEGARKGQPYRIRRFDPNYKPMFNVSKWAFLLDAPFKISASCCDVMKKSPLCEHQTRMVQAPGRPREKQSWREIKDCHLVGWLGKYKHHTSTVQARCTHQKCTNMILLIPSY